MIKKAKIPDRKELNNYYTTMKSILLDMAE